MSGTIYKGPINPNPKDDEASIIIYSYIPSLTLGIIGVLTFTIIVSFQLFYIFFNKNKNKNKNKTKWFHILLLIGSFMEIGGYSARLSSHKRPFVISSFVAQYFLIVVAPVLFSAAIYLSLSLAIRGYKGSEKLLIISPKKVLIFFVTADVITTIIQVVGAALIGSSESAKVRGNSSKVTPQQANNISLAGLSIQCFSFTIFLCILIFSIYKSYYLKNYLIQIQIKNIKQLRLFLNIILITSLLILIRTTFRLSEIGQGFFGFASTHEFLFGILEYLPVILTLFIWSLLPPSKFLKNLNDDRERLDSNLEGNEALQTTQIDQNRV
ncbi:uncharacterized protein I206_103247 [Kwoniella pini CBS 10737]|uniref:Uncharacterized protein n=1 Tax=Kwoniella pini CBS 10737 TaxID=1296096 RepID=A0A1B9IAG4_9TREE|nr:uncharacterized protein I206_01747 [Kwoniella pini CBS 10737]OCF52457.1 hypothetical protein I206_01747 [Kwoniella pini CBS 10737]